MKVKIFSILFILLLINLSLVLADSQVISTSESQTAISLSPMRAHIGWNVEYNKEFTLSKGDTAIIEGHYITLEDIFHICSLCAQENNNSLNGGGGGSGEGVGMCGGCYLQAKLWYFSPVPEHTFYLKQGESKEITFATNYKLKLTLLKLENSYATFIIYPLNQECREGEVEYVSCSKGFTENKWISRKCVNGKWIEYAYAYMTGQPCPPCTCKDNSVCKEGYSCINGKCISVVINCIPEGGHGPIVPMVSCCEGLTPICNVSDKTGECRYRCVGDFFCTKCGDGICKDPENKCNCPKDCAKENIVVTPHYVPHVSEVILTPLCDNGCFSDNKCLPIGYRTNDKYCDADKSLKLQRGEDGGCNNNFECKTNICVDGKCISSGLIQKIIDFFKKLFRM